MARAAKLTAEAALQRIAGRDGGRVYVAGCSGEPLLFADTFRADPSLAAGLVFHGVWIPGVNRTDYAALAPTARAETIFLSENLRGSFEGGRIDVLPLSYPDAFRRMETTGFAAALVQTSPPGPDGRLTLGVACDFTPALLHRKDVLKIAQVNPAMPVVTRGVAVDADVFDVVVEARRDVLTYAPPPPAPVFDLIAAHVATLVGDGATLQFGLGNVQLATLTALRRRRRLRIHSGMVSDGVADAIDAGVVDAVTTGVALGGQALYARAAADARFAFAPVSFTHAHDTLRRIPDFIAVNSVIEVDLFGQANAEFLDGRQISGAGGIVDFLRGAGAAGGGKPVVALASTAKGGAVSRIVPRLAAPAVSVARADMGFVVTEHGIADLRGLSVTARALALVAIAHPDHRPALRQAWSAIEGTL